jgi:hypothetical protein
VQELKALLLALLKMQGKKPNKMIWILALAPALLPSLER